jgi:uncharacterized protein YbjT (DUF2867 family)
MVQPFAKDLPVALIDVRDTGAVGARILIDPAPHAGKTYEFTGKLSKARGLPDWLVAHLVTPTRVTGRAVRETELGSRAATKRA